MVDVSALNRQSVFTDTFWLAYCCCEGSGIGKMDPCILSDVKELCIHSQCGTTDIMNEEGLCNEVSTCICLTNHFALPPGKGTPTCVICNKRLGDPKRANGTVFKDDLFQLDKVIDNSFWCVYCICCGKGINNPGATGPMIGSQFKQLCAGGMTVFESPVTDGIFCSQLGTELCCWSECQMPPAEGNPKIALCNKKMNSDHSKASTTPPPKPVQMDPTKIGK